MRIPNADEEPFVGLALVMPCLIGTVLQILALIAVIAPSCRAAQERAWIATTSTVISNQRAREWAPVGRYGEMHLVDVRHVEYEWIVDGEQHRGDVLDLKGDDNALGDAAVEGVRRGAHLDCWYDPNQPRNAVLFYSARALDPMGWILLLLALASLEWLGLAIDAPDAGVLWVGGRYRRGSLERMRGVFGFLPRALAVVVAASVAWSTYVAGEPASQVIALVVVVGTTVAWAAFGWIGVARRARRRRVNR